MPVYPVAMLPSNASRAVIVKLVPMRAAVVATRKADTTRLFAAAGGHRRYRSRVADEAVRRIHGADRLDAHRLEDAIERAEPPHRSLVKVYVGGAKGGLSVRCWSRRRYRGNRWRRCRRRREAVTGEVVDRAAGGCRRRIGGDDEEL